MKEALVAKLCHEVNRVYCEILGDYSQLTWEETPKNIQDSAINGVEYALNNKDITPEKSHQNWLDFKEKEGWKYGEVKDLDQKTHPCCVSYEQLPEKQKVKDKFFLAIVNTMRPFCLTSE